MEKIESNKLIAEFMGGKFEIQQHNITDGCGYTVYPIKTKEVEYIDFNGSKVRYSHLNYKYNWNLLMPVVDKIENFKAVTIIKNGCSIIGIDDEITTTGSTTIEAVYNAVVEFLTP